MSDINFEIKTSRQIKLAQSVSINKLSQYNNKKYIALDDLIIYLKKEINESWEAYEEYGDERFEGSALAYENILKELTKKSPNCMENKDDN